MSAIECRAADVDGCRSRAPAFGQSDLPGCGPPARIAETIDRCTEIIGFARDAIYVFQHCAPTVPRARQNPEWIAAIICCAPSWLRRRSSRHAAEIAAGIREFPGARRGPLARRRLPIINSR